MGNRNYKNTFMNAKEPECLKLGKRFHKIIQEEWKATADGLIKPEKWVVIKTGKGGRIDVFVEDDKSARCLVVVEIKATDWDRIAEKNVMRNIRRHIRQIWKYIESPFIARQINNIDASEGICPGIIYPKLPKDPNRLKLIEKTLNDEGIAVTWHNETKEECRKRHELES